VPAVMRSAARGLLLGQQVHALCPLVGALFRLTGGFGILTRPVRDRPVRPPHRIARESEDRRHDDGAHDDRVDEDSDSDDESELTEDHERQHAKCCEHSGQDDAGAGDDPTGVGDGLDHALPAAVDDRLLLRPGGEEDRVVDAQCHEEEEREDRHLRIECGLAEDRPRQERAEAIAAAEDTTLTSSRVSAATGARRMPSRMMKLIARTIGTIVKKSARLPSRASSSVAAAPPTSASAPSMAWTSPRMSSTRSSPFALSGSYSPVNM